MPKSKGSNKVETMVNVLRQWQGLERDAMTATAEVMEQTSSPLVRIIMEIIRHDSLMHHRVQQFLVDSVTKQAVTVTREDVAAIWEKIEEHDKTEKKTIELARELRDSAWDPVHKQLFDYLLEDESKHDRLLANLGDIKKGMSLASGA